MASLLAPSFSAAGHRGLPSLFPRTEGTVKSVSASPISEKEWARTVVEYAELMGWWVFRVWLSVKSPAGYPDLTLVREGRVVWAELKSEKGKLTEAQREWLDTLYHVTLHVYVWRPSDWHEVQRVLGR